MKYATVSAPRKLTTKQQKFIEGVVQHGNGAKAARDAGYSAKTAREMSRQNLTKLDISEAVERRKRQVCCYP